MRLTLLVLALFSASYASAEDLRVEFTEPTAREDGAALLPDEVRGYEMCISSGGQCDEIVAVSGPGAVFPQFFNAARRKVAVSLRTVDSLGQVSAWGPAQWLDADAQRIEVTPPPKTPGSRRFTIIY